MCSHYQSVSDISGLRAYYKLAERFELPALSPDTWPGYAAPFIRRADQLEHRREAAAGLFGLLPHWAKDEKFGRRTYNARSETAAEKPSFRDAWRHGRRCVIPAAWIYEPNWETGKAVPWRIARADGEPLSIAGLWSRWRGQSGEPVETFTMLTVNADGHDLFKRFHRVTDEKRMVAILDQGDIDRWLDCPPDQMLGMLTRYPAELLVAEATPTRAPRQSGLDFTN